LENRWHEFEASDVLLTSAVVKATQRIICDPWPDHLCVGESIAVASRATSGLPISAMVLAGPAIMADHRLTFLRPGEIKIKLTQAGNEEFEPAPEIEATFKVTKASQTIELDPLPRETFSGDRIALTAVATSRMPVTFRVLAGPATLSGGRVAIITGTGLVEIEAKQPGNDKFLAVTAKVSFTAIKRPQEILFGELQDCPFEDPPLALNATASSGLPVSFSVVSGPAKIRGQEVIVTGVGRVVIKAAQAGDSGYSSAEVLQSFMAGKARQRLSFKALPREVLAGDSCTLEAFASSGLEVTFSVFSGKATLSGDQLTPTAAGTVVVKAVQAGDEMYEAAEAVQSLLVVEQPIIKSQQTLSFKALPREVILGNSYTLEAVASSGLEVTFSVVSGRATISGYQLIPTAAGSVVIKAVQAGNEAYQAGEAVQFLLALKAEQTIRFDALPAEVSAVEAFPVRARAGSGLPVKIDVFSGPAELVDGELILHGAGEVKIKATQSGDETYGPAPDVVHTLTVVKARQTIDFDLSGESLQVGDSMLLTATASSGEQVTFRLLSGPAELNGNALVGTGAGRVEIEAEQRGDGKHQPAKTQRSLLVVKRSQKITFEKLPDRKLGEPPFFLSAVATSGLPVRLSVVSGPAKIEDPEVALTGAGRVTIKAIQSGDSCYASAESVQSFTVAKGRQTIAFDAAPAALRAGEAWPLQARASSGLPLTFSVQRGKARIAGNQLTPEAAGSLTIKATQTGTENFEVAEAVQSFTVIKSSQTVNFQALPTELFVGDRCPLEAVASSGLPMTFTLVSGKATISGQHLTLKGAGLVVLKATQAGNERFESAEAEQSLQVLKAKQTISFNGLPREASAGESFPLRATAGSGLPVSIGVLSGPAEILNGQLTLHGAGEVKIKATQSGDENYAPAPEVIGRLTAVKAPQTIRFDLTSDELQIGDAIVLAAATSSGQPVSFRLVSGAAELKGNTLVGTGTGGVEIEAEHVGDIRYLPVKIHRKLMVIKRSQDILFEQPCDRKVGDPPFIISATATSGLLVTFTVVSGPAQIKDNRVTLTGAGRVVLKAAQAGDATYAAAELECCFSVGKGRQTIRFESSPAAVAFGDTSTLQASTSSGLPVTFSLLAGKASLTGNRLTPAAVGTLTIKATQKGNEDFEPAEVLQILTVVKAKQTLDFKALRREVFVGDRCRLEAATSSGLTAIAFSVVSGKATISGQDLTLKGAGPVVLKAAQAGNERFEPAEAEQPLQVLKAKQVISFDDLPCDPAAGESFPVRARAGSGLPVNVSVFSGPAEIVDGKLTIHGSGAVKIKATQSGNENYAPAREIIETLTAVKARQTIRFDLSCEELQIGDSIPLAATASSGQPVTFRLVSGPAELNGNLLVATGAGPVEIEAEQVGDGKYLPAKVQRPLLVVKRSQKILFDQPQDRKVGEPPFVVNATATSGLPVTFSVVSGPAQIDNDEVTLTGAGRCVIKAAQAGDMTYAAAEAVCSFAVGKGRQTIRFEAAPGAVGVGGTSTLQAIASSGLPVSFSVVSGKASLRGNQLTPDAAGTLTIKATQKGNANFERAEALQSFTVTKSRQMLSFKSMPNEILAGNSCTLEAVASSGLEVTFSLVSGTATISGDQLRPTVAGSVVIKAVQAGNEIFEPAEVVQSLLVLQAEQPVAKTRQTLSFRTLPRGLKVGNSCTLEAAASSGLEVTFSAVSGAATISGHRLTLSAAGRVVIKAVQAGNETYEPSEAVQSLLVHKAEQVISFDALRSEVSAGESFPVRAMAGSGLPVSIDVLSGPAEIVDGQLILHGPGEVKIKATQSGDENYSPAPVVIQTLSVLKAQQTIHFNLAAGHLTAGESVLLKARASSRQPVTFRLLSGPAELYGETLVGTRAGRVEIEAEQLGDTKYQSAKTQRSLQVVKRTQEIVFDQPEDRKVGEPPFSIRATATSGLPVSFSVASGPANINGSEVTLSRRGKVRIVASQAGDDVYEPAPEVERNFFAKEPTTKRAVILACLGTGLILALTIFLLWPFMHPTPIPKPGFSAKDRPKIKETPVTVPGSAKTNPPAEIEVAAQDQPQIKETPKAVPVSPLPIPPAETKFPEQNKPKVEDSPPKAPVPVEPNPLIKTNPAPEPVEVVVSAEAKTKVYGAGNPSLTVTCSVAINDWNALSNSLTVEALMVSNLTPVGVYEITVKGPPRFGNHAVSYLKNTLTITRAPLRIAPRSISITNGEPLPAFSFNYSGWVNNENESVLSQPPQIAKLVAKLPVGSPYPIQACCASSLNYEISYSNAWLLVAAAPIIPTNQPPVIVAKTAASTGDALDSVPKCDQGLEVLLRRFGLWNKVIGKGLKRYNYSLLDTPPPPIKGAISQLKKNEALETLSDLEQKLRQFNSLDELFKPQLKNANQTRNELIRELKSKIGDWQTSD
jgi:hypothetical protein